MEKPNYIQEDEITLRELILKLQEFYKEVIRSWKLILVSIMIFVALMLYNTYKTPITYQAELTFMVNEDNGGTMGAIGGLAASFGFGGGGEFNLEKILSLLKSRNIIQQVLFERTEYLGKEDYFSNHLIKDYEYHEKWQNNETLKDFENFTDNDLVGFNRQENSVLKQLYVKVIGGEKTKGILSSKVNENTGILTIKINSINEEFSIKFVETLFEKLEKFYIDKTIEKQQKTFVIMSQKVDSIRQTLNSEQSRLLKFMDTNRNLSLRQYESEKLLLQREIQALSMAYGEALKNQEMADFSLRSKTPFIQIIDNPIEPLSPSKTLRSYIKQAIIGGFFGVLLAVCFILGRKILKDTMDEK